MGWERGKSVIGIWAPGVWEVLKKAHASCEDACSEPKGSDRQTQSSLHTCSAKEATAMLYIKTLWLQIWNRILQA